MRRSALILFFIALSCRRAPQHPNVLLITLDTFRADRITSATPNLMKLAKSGEWFRQADCAAPLTLPSHATILSGLLPLHHGLRNNGVGSLPDRPTLATVFSKAGYRTGAFVSAFVLDRRFGLSRGFETYDDAIARDPNDTATTFEAERRGGQTVDRALAWLRRADARPWFAWIHLYDAHAPYAPPAPFPQTYDGEVAYVDAQAGRILSAIDRANTIVVVVGDHGESLGEHGELTHGLLLYESTLHVPLIVAGWGQPTTENRQPISTADIAPMIARMCGLSMTGDKELYAESEYAKSFGWSGLTSVRSGNIKLIRGATSEMFDLARDPAETKNIIDDQRRVYGQLAKNLDAIAATAIATTGTVDAETRAKLASLGYVAPGAATKGTGRDPREMAPLFRRYEEAQAKNSVDDLERLVREDPSNPVFRSTLARAYKIHGAIDRAIALYREAVALSPSDADAWYNLASALQERGRTAEAKEVASEAVRLDPRRPDAHNVLGIADIESGDANGAETEFRKAIDLDRRNARAWNNLANVLRSTGRSADAEKAYRRALEISPAYADPLNGLGVIAVQEGRAAEAIADFDRALAAAPNFYEARLNRAIALQLAGNVPGARAELQRLVTHLPKGNAQRKAAETLLARLPRTQ